MSRVHRQRDLCPGIFIGHDGGDKDEGSYRIPARVSQESEPSHAMGHQDGFPSQPVGHYADLPPHIRDRTPNSL
jgi:hypothetical protein